tara:strand:- start:1219 stop:2802 length:1584 start_codon:yes stop_codon:yes gene_type:complete
MGKTESQQDPVAVEERKQTRRDFVAPADVRWCPGCGDYAILNTIQSLFASLGIPREQFVVVSGIGCSSRFPYYMNTYGFHTIHGRGPAVATGIKLANPDLAVWLITGDGDGLSIGGNHLLHLMRRDVDVKVLLFNNKVYGLTKGQYSPTSDMGMVRKTTPLGSIDQPINPLCFALSSEATFVARTYDTNPKHMASVFRAAAEHHGTAFVEIMQNCVIYNDKVWAPVSARDVRDDKMLVLEEGKPMTFGNDNQYGIRLNGLNPEIVDVGADGVDALGLLVHDEHDVAGSTAYLLARMQPPDFPLPIGVFRAVPRGMTYDRAVEHQIAESIDQFGHRNLQALMMGADYWEVKEGEEGVESFHDEEYERYSLDEELAIMQEQSYEADRYRSDPLFGALRTRINALQVHYGSARVLCVEPDTSIAKAITLMKEHALESLLIVDEHKLRGIITSRDILMKVVLTDMDRETTPITAIMTPRPDVVHEWNTVGDAINKMAIGSFRHLPIVNESDDYGMISVQELLGYVYEQVKT